MSDYNFKYINYYGLIEKEEYRDNLKLGDMEIIKRIYSGKFFFVLVVVLILLTPLLPIPVFKSPYMSSLINTMHFLIMALATYLIAGRDPSKKRMILSIIIPVSFAVLVELLQGSIPNRHMGVDDIIRGTFGSLSVILMIKLRRYCLIWVVVTLISIWSLGYDFISVKIRKDIMYARFPTLDDIHTPFYTKAWRQGQMSEVIVMDSVLVLIAPEKVDWPKMESKILPEDWSAYDTLMMIVRADYKIDLGCCIQNRGVRYYFHWNIDDNIREFKTPLKDFVSGETNLVEADKIEIIHFYVHNLDRPVEILFYRIKLL